MPDVGIKLGNACMPNGRASDRATAPGGGSDIKNVNIAKQIWKHIFSVQLSGFVFNN